MIITIAIYVLGGVGLFILGMILMTDGLKTLAGDTLRVMLSRFTGGRLSAIATGIGITAIMQSSHATLIATIGFVSAGLLTFEQSVGIVIGAHIGTTSTGWLVSLLGLKMPMAMISLPALGAGAMMRLLGREKTANIGLVLAGFGLIFLGIDTLQTGMKDVAGTIDLSGLTAVSLSGRALLVSIGIIMTIIMQSSSAAITMTLAALNTGAITLEQSAALVIGQNVGTTLTAAIAAVGGSTSAKRTAAAHIIFNVITAVAVFIILPWFLGLLVWGITGLGGTDPTIILPAFHTAFNIFGMCIILPLIGKFCTLIEIIIPQKGPVLTRNLDYSVAVIPAVAIEAARRTVRDITISLIDVIIDQLVRNDGARADQTLAAADDALARTRIFLAGIRSRGGSTESERPRHLS
ncbi:MAG: Na/Pi cotransporter family protein, partial [Spirochaetota bacterium]